MQIHEVTKVTEEDLLEGIMDTVAGAFSKDPRMAGMSIAQKGKAIANSKAVAKVAEKAQKVWDSYIRQVEMAVPPADKEKFDNRTDGRYKKLLTAFVAKNLLKGQYIPQLENKSQILALINKLSAPKSNPKNPQFGTTVPAQPATQAQPTAQVNEAATLSSAAEKESFKDLVQQCALAQTIIKTGDESDFVPGPNATKNSGAKKKDKTGKANKQGDAELMQIMTQLGIDPEKLKILSPLVKVIANSSENGNRLSSTGNANVDSLLKQLGFTL